MILSCCWGRVGGLGLDDALLVFRLQVLELGSCVCCSLGLQLWDKQVLCGCFESFTRNIGAQTVGGFIDWTLNGK